MSAGYFAVIPASVRYDESLTPNAKLLYGELTALADAKGYAWASNAYFAKLYKVSAKTVSTWVCSLRDAGHIRVELEMAKGNERKVYISGGIPKKVDGYPEKSGEGYPENHGCNNTVLNSTKNTTVADAPIVSLKTIEEKRLSKQIPFYEAFNLLSQELLTLDGFAEMWRKYCHWRKEVRIRFAPSKAAIMLDELSKRPTDAVEAIGMIYKKEWKSFEWPFFDNQKNPKPRNGSQTESRPPAPIIERDAMIRANRAGSAARRQP